MKPKEALIHFEEHLCKHCCEWNKSLRHCNTCPTDAAKKALEKQIPNKPIFSHNLSDTLSVFHCKCRNTINVSHDAGIMNNNNAANYCSKCGCRLDWSDAE